MKITIEDRLLAKYHAEQMQLRVRGDEEYRAKVEKKAFEQIIAERVRRNLRLGLDKGTNVDLEV
jgi:FixJ family two-component response regulator